MRLLLVIRALAQGHRETRAGPIDPLGTRKFLKKSKGAIRCPAICLVTLFILQTVCLVCKLLKSFKEYPMSTPIIA